MKNKLSIIIAHYYPTEAHYANPLIKTLNSINDDYHEDLDEKSAKEILDSLINNRPLKPGSYRGRKNTAPEKNKSVNGEKHA